MIVPLTCAAPVNPIWFRAAVTRAEVRAVLVGMPEDLGAVMARPGPQETLITKRLRVCGASAT